MKVKAGQMKQQLGRQMKSEAKFKLAKNSFCCFHIATTIRNEKGSETKTFRRLSSSYTCHPEFALATFSPSQRISLCVYAAVALFCSTETLKKQGSGGGGNFPSPLASS